MLRRLLPGKRCMKCRDLYYTMMISLYSSGNVPFLSYYDARSLPSGLAVLHQLKQQFQVNPGGIECNSDAAASACTILKCFTDLNQQLFVLTDLFFRNVHIWCVLGQKISFSATRNRKGTVSEADPSSACTNRIKIL